MLELSAVNMRNSASYAPIENDAVFIDDLYKKHKDSFDQFEFALVIWDLIEKSKARNLPSDEEGSEWICHIFTQLAERAFEREPFKMKVANASARSLVKAINGVKSNRSIFEDNSILNQYSYQNGENAFIKTVSSKWAEHLKKEFDLIPLFELLFWSQRTYFCSADSQQLVEQVLNEMLKGPGEAKKLYSELASHVLRNFTAILSYGTPHAAIGSSKSRGCCTIL